MNYNMSYYRDVYHRLSNRAINCFANEIVSESQIWIKVDEKNLESCLNAVYITFTLVYQTMKPIISEYLILQPYV